MMSSETAMESLWISRFRNMQLSKFLLLRDQCWERTVGRQLQNPFRELSFSRALLNATNGSHKGRAQRFWKFWKIAVVVAFSGDLRLVA